MFSKFMFSGKLPYIGLGLLVVIIGVPLMYFLFTMGGDLAKLLGHESKDTKIERLSNNNSNLKQALDAAKHNTIINTTIANNEKEAIVNSLKDRFTLKQDLLNVNNDFNNRVTNILNSNKKRLMSSDISVIEKDTYANLKIDKPKVVKVKTHVIKKDIIAVKVTEKHLEAKVITVDTKVYMEVGQASLDAIYASFNKVKNLGVKHGKNS